jgi:hypothetical protein
VKKGKISLSLGASSSGFQKILANNMERSFCTSKKYKCYKKWNESRENFRGDCDEQLDSEACLNRQILNNSVKRKAMEDSCERPRKLIHKELWSQYFDTVTYKDNEH